MLLSSTLYYFVLYCMESSILFCIVSIKGCYFSFIYYYIILKFKKMLYMVVLTFESVDEILKCDHSNESY